MEARIKYYILVGILAFSSLLYSQDNRPTSYIGLTFGGGGSHMFLGNQFLPLNTQITPLFGYGGMAGVYYQLEYNHFVVQTGFGIAHTVNNYLYPIENLGTMSANIVEYPMQYHYKFHRFREKTYYGVGYVPIMIGASFRRWHFLVGAKLGVMSFETKNQVIADVTSWATDNDVIGNIENVPTHGLHTYRYETEFTNLSVNPFNAMFSAEIGLALNKRAWTKEVKKKMDRAERYREAKRKKTMKELTHYRLSIFADYGFSNIHSYRPNPVPYNGENYGGLVGINSDMSLAPHSVLGYEANKTAALNNMLIGIKLDVKFEIPKKGPKGLPYMYVYVHDQLTEKPVANARVNILREGTKRPYVKYTDSKYGRVGKGFTPGKYQTAVSHKDYNSIDTILFEHQDDFDTLRVALSPREKTYLHIMNAVTEEPVYAHVKVLSQDGNIILETTTTDSTHTIAITLDSNTSYVIQATAEGFEDYSETLSQGENNAQIKLIPIPKKTFVLQNMHFATAQTTILPSSRKALDLLYELLNENPDLYIRIVGHTDDVGSEEDNDVLSKGRANSIYQEMVKRGINPKRIQVSGKGELAPLVPNTSEANRQKNRRVEIDIISGDEDVNIERLTQ